MGRDKLLVVNNYSMKKSLEMIADRKLPRHHAWGIDRLAEKFAVSKLSMSEMDGKISSCTILLLLVSA